MNSSAPGAIALCDTAARILRLSSAVGATVTPEFFVLDKDRKIAYMGALDDNMRAGQVTKKYVEDATTFERSNRDERARGLEQLVKSFREDIKAKEKMIRTIAEANGTSGADGTEAKNARMQQDLAKLDAEVFSTKRDVQEMEVQLAEFKG